ncbi:thioredoxin peroxidase dot5 [Microsporum audouinii]
MAPELRKRKAPAPAPVAEPKAKRGTKAGAKAEPKKEPKKAPKEEKKAAEPEPEAKVEAEKVEEVEDNKPASLVPEEGDVLDLSLFEDEIELNDGTKTSFKALLEESKDGVAVFTYPKASTPGCTRQACAFRDDYTNLTSTGLSIFGLSGDSPKANTTFKTKQKLPYPLLCDPSFKLIGAFGLKKAPKGTVRGVFAVNKEGKVLLRTPGGPEKTLNLVQELIKGK